MIKLFSWLKGLVIIDFAIKALKHLWPLILLFVFWPEIDSMMSGFSWWKQYISFASETVIKASMTLREIPVVGNIIDSVDEVWNSVRLRILNFLS